MKNNSKIIDGRKLAKEHEEKLIGVLNKTSVKPHVVSVLIGDDPASQMYTNMKQKKAEEIGILFEVKHLPQTTLFQKVVNLIDTLNYDNAVHGIMVQLPLPKDFLRDKRTDQILEVIDSEKDIDGLTGDGPVLPATVRGVLSILEAEGLLGKGRKIGVVGGIHGTVGTKLAAVFRARGEDAVGISRSDPQLAAKTQEADVLISSVGQKNLITVDMVKPRAVVIDIGQDVDFENVQKVASRITPPKGGVGPMTIISLMENAFEIAQGSTS